jgi:2-polyprenyl-3-methyl-5-hydroxy-6-metoxy-1,4-benzoquinol methylase
MDHSKSYSKKNIQSITHRHRLNSITQELSGMRIPQGGTFCDLGCSNGFITSIIQRKFNFSYVAGMDHDNENILNASIKHSHITFTVIDLNEFSKPERCYDLVTCFETLEHVGNIENALDNILNRIKPGGNALITVPIERGITGIIKYLIKKILGYSVSELKISDWRYFCLIVRGDRISKSRPKANHYKTHFGFDYLDIDELLKKKEINFTAFNKLTTRFYKISS